MAINLVKGQTVNLTKPTDGGLTTIRLGLGWDTKVIVKKRLFGKARTVSEPIDLDASALLVGGGKVREIVYFGHLRSKDGSVQHTGDNLTGAGDGDDESILVHLPVVPPTIEHIVFTVNSFSGETFEEIEGAYVRVVDSADHDAELARYTLTGSGPHTALVMARVSRSGSTWTFTAIGQPGKARVARELEPLVLADL